MNLLHLLGVCMIGVLTVYMIVPALCYVLYYREIRGLRKNHAEEDD